jgi:hypothetical protein
MKLALKILSVAVLAFPVQALAQESEHEPDSTYRTVDETDGYEVTFKDELLDGGGLDATTAILRVRPPGSRMILIRPRLHFVHELTKTVENL